LIEIVWNNLNHTKKISINTFHEKYLKEGLKLGADVNVNERQARFVAKYESRKNTEVI
jgi:hypothetical protein